MWNYLRHPENAIKIVKQYNTCYELCSANANLITIE